MRVLVCTVVHHPADARIYYRQIRALLDAGHDVTYIAPFESSFTPTGDVTAVTIPRAVGRRRLTALRAARRELRRNASSADIILIHDPELLLVLPPRRARPPVVWDVHEDTAAALTTKAWLPTWLRPVAAGGVLAAERLAERRLHLILAETGYQDRFRRQHPIVPNVTYVPKEIAPPSEDPRVIYVGHLSPDRGVPEMVALGSLLRSSGVEVHLAGPADAAARALIESAGDAVTWHGFVPNDAAMKLVDGALAGLSLLRDEANFRHSMPTKVVEYMARGVPVITTPLPLAVDLVESAGCGFVVPFEDPDAVRDAVLRLAEDRQLRVKLGAAGHDAAQGEHAWPARAAAFITQLEQWAARDLRAFRAAAVASVTAIGPGTGTAYQGAEQLGAERARLEDRMLERAVGRGGFEAGEQVGAEPGDVTPGAVHMERVGRDLDDVVVLRDRQAVGDVLPGAPGLLLQHDPVRRHAEHVVGVRRHHLGLASPAAHDQR
jgi:glycosyltransferase involved in cell wall biosynthesis